MKRLLLLLLCLSASLQPVFSQEPPKDYLPQDSSKFYYDLYERAKKKKFSFLLYKIFFNVPGARAESTDSTDFLFAKKQLARHRGKIIKDIRILTFEPFGFSIRDTNAEKQLSLLEKTANNLHIKSRPSTIINNLLFKKNDRLNPLDVSESERILRQTEYINDARIVVQGVPGTDSVNIIVISQDLWSIEPGAYVSASKLRLSLTENNFLGLGHIIDNQFLNFPQESSHIIFNGSYTIPNFNKSFVSSTLYYTNELQSSQRGFTIGRNFYSPLTRWAGGISYLRTNLTDSVFSDPENIQLYKITFDYQDAWLGHSFPLSAGETEEEQSTRIITALRYSNTHFQQRPSFDIDTNFIYQHTRLYLLSFGLSNRRYYKDRYLFRFGITEDVPEGRIIAFISGIENTEFESRNYSGIKTAFGNRLPGFGYLSAAFEYGNYIANLTDIKRGVLNVNILYFNELIKIKKFYSRNFLSLKYTSGINRDFNEYINLNAPEGIFGFKSTQTAGTSKMVFNFQTVLYTPYRFAGFRFAPLFYVGAGLLGGYGNTLLKSRLYSGIGAGVLIRNDYLVFNTFQLSVAIYPFLPESDHAVLKINPLGIEDRRLRDFDLNEPQIVSFE